jgi:diguanylate cyclase (GGDEF)-like protein
VKAALSLITDKGPAGRLLRIDLPAALIVIMLSGLLMLGAHRLGYVGTAVGGAIFGAANAAAVVLAILRAAWVLHSEYNRRRQTEDDVQYHAIHDPLTGLANRGFFLDQLARRAALAERHTTLPFAVCSLELDSFGRITEQLGPEAARRILVKVADVIHECVRASDLVARLDGDKFGILLEAIADARDVDILAQRIVAAVPPALSAISGGFPIMVNIGGVLGEAHNGVAGDMLRDSDAALQLAKKHGPGRFELTAFAD